MQNDNLINQEDIRQAFKKGLLYKKQDIEEAIHNLKENHRIEEQFKSPDASFEEIDRAGNEISAQQYYSFLERKSSELRRIEVLIQKIQDNGEFGLCEECGERIGYKRLLAMPDATLCISCQREFEKMNSRKSFSPMKYKNSSDDIDVDDEDIDDAQELRVFIGNILDKGTLAVEDLDEIDFGDTGIDNEDSASDDLNGEDEE